MTPNTIALLCHLSSLSGYLGNGIGFVIGPLLVWLWKREELPQIDAHGKEALNFNLTILIAQICLFALTLVSFGLLGIITIPIMILIVPFHIVFTIIAALKANAGEMYSYPLNLRLLK